MRFTLLSLSFLLLVAKLGFCQDVARSNWDGIGFEHNFKWSKMIKHSKKFTGPLSDRVMGYELHVLYKTYGRKEWQERRNYPTFGFAFNYVNYGYNDIYGTVYGISPTITLNLIKVKNLEWTLRAGFGLAYATKFYSRPPSSTSKNASVGGHINNLSPFATDIRWHISNKWSLHAGLQFTHVSNASFHIPNLGINAWGAQLGFRYFPTTANAPKIKRDSLSNWRKPYGLQLRTSIGFKEAGPYGGPIYKTTLLGLQGYKIYKSKNRIFVGAEYQYHQQVYAFHKNNMESTKVARQEARQVSVHIGHEFLVGCFGIIGQVGYYLKDIEDRNIPIYQKLGVQIYAYQNDKTFIKQVYTNILLKTHLANAEVVELGIGLAF